MFNKELQTLLTNLEAAVGKNNTQYKRKLKEWNCTKEGNGKILNALERGSTRLALYSNKDTHAVTSLCSWYGKNRSNIIHLLAYRTAYLSYLTLLSYFTLFLLYLTLLFSSISLG